MTTQPLSFPEPTDWQPPESPHSSGYVSPAGLARVLRWLLAGWVVLAGIATAASFVHHRLVTALLDGELENGLARVQASEELQSIIGLVQILGLGVTGAVFIAWTRRVYRNLAPLGTSRRFGPGWAIGGWFVPVLNLWRPKQILNDVWRATEHGDDHAGVSTDTNLTLLNAWWATLIISRVVGWGYTGSADDGVDTNALGAMVLVDFLTLIAAILAFWVVVRITERQEGYAARIVISSAETPEWLTPRSAESAVGLAHEPLVRWGLPLLGLAAVSFAGLAISNRPDPDRDTVSTGPTDVHVLTLDRGDCFNLPSELVGSAAPGDIADVEQVPCYQLHDAEMYAVHADESTSRAPYPGPDEVEVAALDFCYSEFEKFVGLPYEESIFDYYAVWPTEAAWTLGDRTTTCSVARIDEIPVRGTAEGSRR
jgi:hypothetical protein